jgi:hypothetical protein
MTQERWNVAEPSTYVEEILEEGLQAMEYEASMLSREREALQRKFDSLIQQLEHSVLPHREDNAWLAENSDSDTSDEMVPFTSCGQWHAECQAHARSHVSKPLGKRTRTLEYPSKIRGTLPVTLEQARALHKKNVAAEERAIQFSEDIKGKLYELQEQDRCTRWAGA